MGKKSGPFDPAEAALQASLLLENAKGMVAMVTQLRQQYIDAGWSEHGAELMVHAMFIQGAKGK